MKTKTLLTSLLMVCTINLFCQIIHVPSDQPTIQAGINAASNGDTVLVEDGTYYENINFLGKAITVASHYLINGDETHIDNTIIDGSQATNPDSAAVVMFCNGEDTTSILNGFSITGGTGMYYPEFQVTAGGGIACWNAGAKIVHNKIYENEVTNPSYAGGGGIACIASTVDCWVVIENNTVIDNVILAETGESFGGGIYVMSDAKICNNTIEQNSSYCASGLADGGGIGCESCGGIFRNVIINNNTIKNNIVEGYNKAKGGGIYTNYSTPLISNNIINNNSLISNQYSNGGGIYAISPKESIHILNNEISDNVSSSGLNAYGGGFRIYHPQDEVMIQNNVIIGNSCLADSGTYGSAFLLHKPIAKTIISKNTISNNSALGEDWSYGGVILWDAENATVIVDGNIFMDNSAKSSGGFYSRNSYNLLLTNNLFSGNTVDTNGGAIYFHQDYENKSNVDNLINSETKNRINKMIKTENFRPMIINNTFTGNHAGVKGGAIFTTQDYDSLCPVIFNNIFWDNDALNGKDIYHNGNEHFQIFYNDIDTNQIVGNWSGEENIFEDPLFIDTLCHLDSCVSSCINSGIATLEVNGTWYYCPTNDIDNEARPYENTLPDIGADETPCLETSIKSHQDILSSIILNNFPNPFQSKTTIEFSIPQANFVKLTINDFTGKEIQTVVSKQLPAGTHRLEWNAEGLNSGLYFLRLETNGISETSKLLLLR